ncbi:CBS domain-containing membrane protein [Sinobacterium caligoides]|uniref:CBS domain-containing membrane protein n=1 Tax=Sinobacterium caligoides TaxID=933926 RepID=A0A3N2DPS9_9GAMM|nr:HPP family protein [Sinobacterium caligoides]ROS01806.1 CBS domain-containing membrane protein [Sinobacterium caligoides]
MKIIQRKLSMLLAVPAGRGSQYFIVTTLTAFCCLLCVSLVALSINDVSVGGVSAPMVLPSMGAAAVLMFAAPNSPMAKPWAFIVGNISSAIVGVTVYQLLGDSVVAGPLAVGLAIASMHVLRCQHPPGGATALIAVLGGEQIYALGYGYVVMPVAINIAAFMFVVVVHRHLLFVLAEGKKRAELLGSVLSDGARYEEVKVSELYQIEDIKQALRLQSIYIDASPAQLSLIFQASLQQARGRKLGERCCGENMIGEDATIEYGASLLQAWEIMCEKNYDYLVVVNRARQVEGKITAAAIIAMIELYGGSETDGEPISLGRVSPQRLELRLRKVIAPSGKLHSARPEVVGQLMEAISRCNRHQLLSTLESVDQAVAVVDADDRFIGCVNNTLSWL